jgi:hypothetical protein
MELDEPAAPATKSKRHVREVSALRAWHAVLASFLRFAPPVANAETVQIIDDRGGLIIAYQMQWAMLAPQIVNVQIKGPCVSACNHIAWLYTARKNLRKPQGLSRVPFGRPGFCH